MPLDPFLMNYLLTGQISKKQQEKMDSAEQNAIESGMEPEEAKNLATEAFSKPLDPQNYSLTGQTRFPEPRPFEDALTAPRLEEKKDYYQFGNPNNVQWPSTQEVYLNDFPRSDQVAKSEEATKPEETDKPEDVAAAQAIAGAKQTKVNPDESKQLNKDLEKASSQKAQEDIEKALKDPRAYLMEKYKIGDKSQELEKLQKRSNILESVSDLDKALGQLGSWKYVLAKKMGYDVPGYKGGGLADIAAKEKQQFSEKLAMDQAERDQLTKAFAAEKTEKEFKRMLEDEQELDNPSGALAEALNNAAETIGLSLPKGSTPRQILRVAPDLIKLAEQRKAKAAEIKAVGEERLAQIEAEAPIKAAKTEASLAQRREEEYRRYAKQQNDEAQRLGRGDPVMKKIREQSQSFDVIDPLLQASKSGNQAAIAALGASLARAMGEVGVLTEEDVKRYTGSETYARKLQAWAKRKFVGEMPEGQIQDLQKLVKLMSEVNNEKVNRKFDEAAKILMKRYPVYYSTSGEAEEMTLDRARGLVGHPAYIDDPEMKEKRHSDIRKQYNITAPAPTETPKSQQFKAGDIMQKDGKNYMRDEKGKWRHVIKDEEGKWRPAK